MIGLGGCLTTIMAGRRSRFVVLPGFKATSCLTVVLLICLETVLLSTVSNCAKTFYMHWNTTNSIFRIDNTDHIIDVNKGNLAFEYDQVHIICPVYEPGTFDNETEKYIIYNVSKVEYETCRITNANPRIIAICDQPQRVMFFTITFRPFTPQPGGLEFRSGTDYYFISTSSKDDLHRRIGGRCSTNNMKVVFKVCCAATTTSGDIAGTMRNQSHSNGDAVGGGISLGTGIIPHSGINTTGSNIVQSTMSWPSWNAGVGGGGIQHSTPSITSTNTIKQYPPYQSSPRPNINTPVNGNSNPDSNSNNSPSHKPTKKTNEYDKHPNEVVQNEELTYNSAATDLRLIRNSFSRLFGTILILSVLILFLNCTVDGTILSAITVCEFRYEKMVTDVDSAVSRPQIDRTLDIQIDQRHRRRRKSKDER